MERAESSARLAKAERERDLYHRLLQLGREREIEPLLRAALALVVDVTGARQGYLEVYEDEEHSGTPRWWIAHGFSSEQVQQVRAAISRGIIAEAVATGQTVVTPSAMLDPRFSALESVRVGKIEAVLCTPIGDDPPRGVLYLQGRAAPGLFSDEERERAELFAQHLAPFVSGLLQRQQAAGATDPTQALRQSLRLDGVIGHSEALAQMLRQVALLAPLDVNVLLTGDSGTGKSQLARILHDNGPRAGDPFVHINCAALPETLVESELFGALPGAHSTATRRMEGKVAAAERGTLFLDEIGDLPLAVQAKLLHLLQSKEYFPLGSARALRADVRLIAATNVDLKLAVAEHRFREDLYFRIQVLPVRVPSLAERREDIAEIAASWCAQASARYALPRLELSRNAVRALETAAWPGNVRQLGHCVEAAAIRCAGEGSTQIERRHLFPEDPARAAEPTPLTFQEATRQFQERLLCDVLDDTGWNVVEAAKRLDMARSSVYNLIRAFGIERKP